MSCLLVNIPDDHPTFLLTDFPPYSSKNFTPWSCQVMRKTSWVYLFLHSLLCDMQYTFSKKTNVSYVTYLRITLSIMKILLLSFGGIQGSILRIAVDKSHSFLFIKHTLVWMSLSKSYVQILQISSTVLVCKLKWF